MIDEKVEKELLARLTKVEGQIKGIAKMISKQRYCIDVILQIAAAEAALHKVSEIIMRNHLETCVLDAFRSYDEKQRKEKVDELMQVYTKLRIR